MLLHRQTRLERLWTQAKELHGDSCILLALGCRVCDTALKHLGLEDPAPRQLVCVAESVNCAVDAISLGLKCTIGQRHLLFYKTGKLIFTVYDLHSSASVRMLTRQDVADRLDAMTAEELFTLPEEALFTFEPARAMTPKVLERVRVCPTHHKPIPQRERGVQDSPDGFRKFDQQKTI